MWLRVRKDKITLTEQSNPTELKSALVFTGLFALVLLAVSAAKTYLGERGLFAVALLSGLTDMDAITLSTAQIANAGQVTYSTAWRLILAAAMASASTNRNSVGGTVAAPPAQPTMNGPAP